MSSMAQGTRVRRSLLPWLFPAALLPTLLANGALIYFALQSKPALVAAHPFEDGRRYNHELAAAAEQSALGWSATFAGPSRSLAASPVGIAVRDSNGLPVRGLSVELRVWRPVGAEPDLHLQLPETSPGRYAAAVLLPQAGQWQFDIVARRGDAEFVFARRLVVP